MKRNIILIVLFLVFLISAYGQKRNYYTFHNKDLGISFKCPTTWIFIPDTTKTELEDSISIKISGGRFISNNKDEYMEYADCYDGIIFYIEVNQNSLDSTLLKDGSYIKKDGNYFGTFSYMSDRLVPTDKVKGKFCKGIHHFNTCRIYCKEDDVSPIVDECEFLHLTAKNKTVSISTTGKAIDKEILQEIISSFKIKN